MILNEAVVNSNSNTEDTVQCDDKDDAAVNKMRDLFKEI
jgi:hypothetical protein